MKRIAVGFALLLLAVTGVLWMRIPATLAPPDETLTFDGLPLDVPQRVEFEVPEPEQFGAASMTGYRMSVAAGQDPRAAYRREVQDQIRDWLLFTVLGASGVPAAVMNEALYDVPPVRRGHSELISALEYGTTRSRSLQNRDAFHLLL